MRPRRDLPRGGMFGSTASVVRARPRGRAAMGEQEARHAIGERRLADALRAADQPGMVQPPARRARRGRPRSASPWPKNAGCSRGCGAPASWSGSSDASVSAGMGFADRLRGGDLAQKPLLDGGPDVAPRPGPASRRGVDDDAALGLVVRRCAGKPRAGARGTPIVLRLEAVGLLALARVAAPRPAPSPISAGTSRMKVRSGRVASTTMRSSARQQRRLELAVAPW